MRKCCNIKFPKQSYLTTSYKYLWNSIFISRFSNENISNIESDLFFTEVPFSQEYLTEIHQIYRNQIQYNNFVQSIAQQINKSSLYECFHGILFYIYYYSENKFNIEELEFHFSGSPLQNLSSAKLNPNQLNILNIFDYHNINTEFLIKPIKNTFFGITFTYKKIYPITYSIRSGLAYNGCSHLISFTFEGFDDDNKKLVVLDERTNINDLTSTCNFSLFFVRYTYNSFSSFRIVQTDPSNNEFCEFSISAFDILDIVTLKTPDIKYSEDNQFLLNEINIDNEKYDLTIDITEFLF